MSISANPLERVASTPVLGALFNGLGLTQGPDPIVVKSTSGAGNDNGNNETERCTLNPGARSLKERVLTLINNNKPGIALDILQNNMASAPEAVEAIADDVLYELKEAGFERDTQEFKSMLASADLDAPKPKSSAEQTLDAITFG